MTSTREVLIAIQVCLLALVPSCESAQQKLKSLNDLKKIDFGQSVPKHSLLLLHWFANVIDIDNNDVLHLTFDPNAEDFGSHHYGNYEDMLDPLPQARGYSYYTVGNLRETTANELPEYVLHPPDRECVGNNMDRIIFRVQDRNSGVNRIDRVYLTQHYGHNERQGTRYNPEQTYNISPRLLQEMRLFAVEDNPRSLRELRDMFDSDADNSQLRDLQNIWGHSLALIGLLLFIVKEERKAKQKPTNNRQSPARRTTQADSRPNTQPNTQADYRRNTQADSRRNTQADSRRNTQADYRRNTQADYRRNTQADFVVDVPDEMLLRYCNLEQSEQLLLKVETGGNGKATIVWRNVARHRLKEGITLILYNPEKDQKVKPLGLIQQSEGRYDTSVPLNDGLQIQMHRAKRQCYFWTKVEEEICKGRAFKSPGPVSIPGFEAYLQLFVKDSKACARLFVNKSFTQWRSVFKNSWVGFYDSAEKDTADYRSWQWQWAVKFKEGPASGFYNTYEYYSGITVAPGVQARFILSDNNEIAQTPIWS
ncbi:uncharacterized protein [Eucyclogobius newberryi]|uniref:uncharacterized protein n=1 Tax=Eucyclogobius newberryi TaxID=166745 RepID=UPI003B5C5DD1